MIKTHLMGRNRPPDSVAMLARCFGIALRSAPNRRTAAPHEMGLYQRDLVLALHRRNYQLSLRKICD
jgi:hypothetical protein